MLVNSFCFKAAFQKDRSIQLWPYINKVGLSLAESLFNRRVEEKSKELLFTPLGWHHSNLDLLREENGEKQAMERLL